MAPKTAKVLNGDAAAPRRSARNLKTTGFGEEELSAGEDIAEPAKKPAATLKQKAKAKSSQVKGRKKIKAGDKYEDEEKDDDAGDSDAEEPEPSPKAGIKRKRSTKTSKPRTSRKPKTSAPKAADAEEELPKPNPSTLQLLKYLISPSSLALCRPTEESKALAASPQSEGYRTYSSSVLTPFEELLSAIILSRPISHALGHRTIRTILNPPYLLTTPRRICDAGFEKAREATFAARTQHKEKTAAAIVGVADFVLERCSARQQGGEKEKEKEDSDLDLVREQAGFDVAREREILRGGIRGLGPVGLDIFFRRVQWLWTEAFPFMDAKTMDACARLGLPDEAEELFEMVEVAWEVLDLDGVQGSDEEERRRRAFVVLLERIVGAVLEGKMERVLREAEGVFVEGDDVNEEEFGDEPEE